MKRKYIYIATRLLVVAAAIYAYVEMKQIVRKQSPGSTIPTVLVRHRSPMGDGVWFTIFRHNHPEKTYVDVYSDGKAVLKLDQAGKTQARSGEIADDLRTNLFAAAQHPEVLKVTDPDPGEALFSEQEWIQGGVMQDGRSRLFGPAPLELYPQQLTRALTQVRAEAKKFAAARVQAFLTADVVEKARKQAIEADARRLYRFVALKREALPDAILFAVSAPGRQVAVDDSQTLRYMEKLRAESNLKATGTDIFVIVSGRAFQIHTQRTGA